MKPESLDIKSVFAEALEKANAGERAAYLDRVCGKDTPQRSRVESLLLSYEQAEDFLPSPDVDQAVTLDSAAVVEGLGTVIGRYKLLEKIGEGGMAVVYMAEQQEPVRRKVALKIIKLGMDTRQIIARFEAERQALALLDHPNIAKVFDAGATDAGRPYFVMELVRGVTITEYCDQNKLDMRQRLGLFVQVCRAVQHAHHKGIIHRDIKPSNVMVTMHDDKPVPKVIDFGIAKATNQRLTEKTLFTRYAQMIGTPAYMSPEQAQMSGLDVDTRTDIYSLGVLLYELLTGTTPFESRTLQQAGYAEIERIIRETDPPRPSTRLRNLGQHLTDVAQGRHTSGEALGKLIRGDLDCIVMKCLEKDRARRYETAHGLADDVERYLRDEPVLARSPGVVYRLQKFTRRHRAEIAVATVVTVLLASLIVTARMYQRASNLEWAKGEALPQMVEFVKNADYRSAFSLAQKAKKYIPQDPTFVELWPRICKDYSITTTPPGAQIWCREYSAVDEPWKYLGRSPLENITLAQCTYRWKIQMTGFATHECVVGDSIVVQLREEDPTGEMVGMEAFTVEVPTGASGQPGMVEAPAYLIDKYEVTNERFKTFVDHGCYDTPQCWEGLKFLKDGRELDWAQAVAYFRDRTGRPGPSTWTGGTYPIGQGQHPVSGVSWFEAAAYARFIGKSLPTLHHWEHAACLDESLLIVPYSHFTVDGTTPVGSHPGMGHTGLYDMAGNVKEWCWSAVDEPNGPRYILGGGWGEQTYMFTKRDFRSPWDRSPVNGFRCADYPHGEQSVANVLFDPAPQPQVTRDYSSAKPCTDEEYRIIRRQYECDQRPLNAVIESIDEGSPFLRRCEKITFDAAYGGERVTAYLFIPKDVDPPYQTVVYWPGDGATREVSFQGLPDREFTEFVITSGRALLFPVYKGTFERRLAVRPAPDGSPSAFTEWIIQTCKDLQRCLDYLETREDIDSGRMAYYGMSAGAVFGPMALAVEHRFKAAVLAIGGFPVSGPADRVPAIDPLNHAPRVRTPVLMINGEGDFFFPLESSQRPMYQSLGTPEPDKEHRVYPGGHGLLSLFGRQIRDDVLGWLDRYLGPVNGKKGDTK
jgi:serine/threonine protein kinase/dienelactone hydrolase